MMFSKRVMSSALILSIRAATTISLHPCFVPTLCRVSLPDSFAPSRRSFSMTACLYATSCARVEESCANTFIDPLNGRQERLRLYMNERVMFWGIEARGVRRLIPFAWQGANITMHKRHLKKDGHLCATKIFKQCDFRAGEGGTKLYQLCISK